MTEETRDKPAESDPGVNKYYSAAHGYTEGADIVEKWKSDVKAHLSDKPRCECELFVEKYFGLSPKFPEDQTVSNADYGNLVNMLAMFKEEQLDAANARIKKLEDALAGRILYPTKSQILEAWAKNWRKYFNYERTPFIHTLSEVLDDLKIK